MAYGDPIVTQEYVSAVAAQAGIQIEVEGAASICRRIGAVLDPAAAAPAGSVAIDGIRVPHGATLESFGFTVTEALTNGNATHCLLALKVVDKEGGTTTTVATITVPKDSTEVTPTTQTSPSTTSAANAVAAGARFIFNPQVADLKVNSQAWPSQVPGGGIFFVEVTQAAGAAGGAIRPFVVYRPAGYETQGSTTSPVSELTV